MRLREGRLSVICYLFCGGKRFYVLCPKISVRSCMIMPYPKVILFICAVFVIYLAAYFHCPSQSIQIAQSDLVSLTDDVLLAKRPLLITDRVIHQQDLTRLSAFRLLHITSSPLHTYSGRSYVTASARFTLIFQSHADHVHVLLMHPLCSEAIVVVLYRYQTLVLPPRWRYACVDTVFVLELHDCISLIMSRLWRSKSERVAKRSVPSSQL